MGGAVGNEDKHRGDLSQMEFSDKRKMFAEQRGSRLLSAGLELSLTAIYHLITKINMTTWSQV